MAEAAVLLAGQVPINALEAAILDRSHLARMTFGDRNLEREVLQLFYRQAGLLMERIHRSAPAAIATLAHTLKGSAVGVGAVRVARAAANAELTASRTPDDCENSINQLAQAVDEARAYIASLLSIK